MKADLKTQIHQKAAEVAPRMVEFRRQLHAHPELSMQEFKTAALVADKLKALGLEPKTWVGGRGVTALIEGTGSTPTSAGGKKKTVGLRADMDALPLQELNDLPYKSTVPGVMHACGHDGHTANLLGTAEVLCAVRAHFSGTVKLVFQPAEEKGGGGNLMVQEGVLENPAVDAMFGFHGGTQFNIGQFGIINGPAMAASDGIHITVTGQGGHAAGPHAALNPISALVRIAAELETIPATCVPASEMAVVTIANIQAGLGASNVIPDQGRILGTVRTHKAEIRKLVAEQVLRVAGRWRELGYTVEAEVRQGYPPVVNDPGLEPVVRRALSAQFSAEVVNWIPTPTMGGEDFAYYGEKVPAYFMRVGVAPNPALHNPKFNFADEALPYGMQAFARIAVEYLNGG